MSGATKKELVRAKVLWRKPEYLSRYLCMHGALSNRPAAVYQ